jgi:multisubunit Na+/H+ antiporter MnhF subunit
MKISERRHYFLPLFVLPGAILVITGLSIRFIEGPSAIDLLALSGIMIMVIICIFLLSLKTSFTDTSIHHRRLGFVKESR